MIFKNLEKIVFEEEGIYILIIHSHDGVRTTYVWRRRFNNHVYMKRKKFKLFKNLENCEIWKTSRTRA